MGPVSADDLELQRQSAVSRWQVSALPGLSACFAQQAGLGFMAPPPMETGIEQQNGSPGFNPAIYLPPSPVPNSPAVNPSLLSTFASAPPSLDLHHDGAAPAYGVAGLDVDAINPIPSAYAFDHDQFPPPPAMPMPEAQPVVFAQAEAKDEVESQGSASAPEIEEADDEVEMKEALPTQVVVKNPVEEEEEETLHAENEVAKVIVSDSDEDEEADA